MTRILIVEDDEDIALSLEYNLGREGFAVTAARDGEAGLAVAVKKSPDLVLLDLNLPGIDGLEVCRQLRSRESTSKLPIIMLTARVDETERIKGLDIGADDYITKPFSVKEVLARVRAVLRRAGGGAEEREALSAGTVRVDLDARRVRVDDREVSLTRREFDLLTNLMRNRGRVRTRERLLEQVWGYLHPGESRTVDVHIRQLRRKLGAPADTYIETVVGVGYRFKENS